MKRSSIASFIAALLLGTVALITLAQAQPTERYKFWPPLKKDAPVLTEWFSDVPWHQKLGTYAGNAILVPLIFPFEILPQETKDYCNPPDGKPEDKLSEEHCMIEVGVGNILGYQRFDTLYDPTDSKIAAACTTQACTEVRLEISNFSARKTRTGVELVAQKIAPWDEARRGLSGFNLTDGSSYAPQMLWEMSHYCDSMWALGDMQDPVCYADYFSPMNDGFHLLATKGPHEWPKSSPWSVWPTGAPPEPTNQCKPGDTACVMVLGSFGMGRVPKDATNLQYKPYNNLLVTWFSNAMVAFPRELGAAELQNHFPWNGKPVTWDSYIYPLALQNPFLGSYAPTSSETAPAVGPNCDTGIDGGYQDGVLAPQGRCADAPHYQAAGYTYPRSCSFDDLAGANSNDLTIAMASADRLRACGVNYEVHPNGWMAPFPAEYHSLIGKDTKFSYDQNEYGRTSFLFGGVPGMQMPVSFAKTDPTSDKGLSIYEQVHNASLFSLYLPVANFADVKRAMGGRNYVDTAFYHTLLMSNHMESKPEQFADGIRGKVLWHNEWRMEPMYEERAKYTWLKDRTFQASFDPLKSKYDAAKAPAPFHNNTCDGCHVRNGSGVPINTQYQLDATMTTAPAYMADKEYIPFAEGNLEKKDYTFTGVIRPMKLVFFDLQPPGKAPQTATTDAHYYSNAVMNFYGDSFHVSPKEAGNKAFNYTWTLANADTSRLVVSAKRFNKELQKQYVPQQIKLGTFTTPADCQLARPPDRIDIRWPKTCADIADAAIQDAVTSSRSGAKVGYMHLNGKRLGNLGVIEAIPNKVIQGFQTAQQKTLGLAAGSILWGPGSRDGITGKDGSVVKKDCLINSIDDCFIGRFGWVGDRGTLEDQVANAAFVEMNITSGTSYNLLYGAGKVANPIRYKTPNCGPANKTCTESIGNSDLSERDIQRMADYGRWLGNPTRSEVQVSQPEVIAGEKIFRRLQCNTCHVIDKIDIDPDDTVLIKNFRDRLQTHIKKDGNNKIIHTPFLSYIGTDLLMHDMGYLSQVGEANPRIAIRDSDTGLVKEGYAAYVQKIRTPPLKGMRLNNYVTDAHRNTKSWKPTAIGTDPPPKPSLSDPGCDFLLHDGRACNAIEAAFLHDGPAIKSLKVIEELNKLEGSEVLQLRAFLYSL